MAGLVSYASSDDENDTSPQNSPPEARRSDNHSNDDATTTPQCAATTQENESNPAPIETSHKTPTGPLSTSHPPQLQQPNPQSTIGPVALGPSLPPPAPNLPEPPPNEESDSNAPSSPYSSSRAIIHDLTLPSIPNLDIPPSPPGSPPPATNKKFQQFLDLKRKGTHFNTKLESSTALRNPSLTDKLLAFVDLTGPAQYETTLSLDLYDPSGLPECAHREQLRKSRETLVKEREGDKVASRRVDFVSSSNNSTPVGGVGGRGGLSRSEKRTSGWK